MSRDGAMGWGYLLVLGVIAGFVYSAGGASLVARWKLDEPGPVYADAVPGGVLLNQDAATTTAISDAGIEGASAQLNWQPTPGVSTRLSASGSSIQTDSFGFSFWFNPVYLNDGDNLIAKEMAFYSTASNALRLAWQVRVRPNSGSSAEPLELVVRGDNRTEGDFFGSVTSATNVPLHSSLADWIHVAGGYDAGTGSLRLYVNGVESVSNNSSPGAHNSDGSPVSVGTVRNGADFVAFSAGASIEDIQLYDGPLSASDVSFLYSNPGRAIRTFSIIQFSSDGDGAVAAILSTVPGAEYTVEGAAGLSGFTALSNFTAVADYSLVEMSKATIDGVLGPAPRPELFLRAKEQVPLPGFELCN